MTQLTITVYITNSANKEARHESILEISGEYIEKLAPIIDEVRIEPPSGPAGTLFTFTILAHDPNTPPLEVRYSAVGIGPPAGTYAQSTSVPNVFTWQS